MSLILRNKSNTCFLRSLCSYLILGCSERSCNTSMCMVVAKATVIKDERKRTQVAQDVHGMYTFYTDL